MRRAQTSQRSEMAPFFLKNNMSLSLQTHQLTSKKPQALILTAGRGVQCATWLKSSLLSWCHLSCGVCAEVPGNGCQSSSS